MESVEIKQGDVDRFWSKVKKGEPNECWEWTASKLPKGYGVIFINKKNRYAHRVSFEIHNSIDLSGVVKGVICHKCDNPSCVNPNHLSLGTQAENIQDMVKKGRAVRHNSLKTECIRGHKLEGKNITISKDGRRTCNICHYDKLKARRLEYKLKNGIIDFKDRTHCPRGHEYTFENTRVSKKGSRHCKMCDRASCLRAYYKRKNKCTNH